MLPPICLWQCHGPVPQYSRTGYIATEGELVTTDDGNVNLDLFVVPDHAATHYVITVTAFEDATGDAKFFELEGFFTGNGGGPAPVDTPTSTVLKDTGAGTTLWEAVLETGSMPNLVLRVKGDDGKDIRWKSQLKMSETL